MCHAREAAAAGWQRRVGRGEPTAWGFRAQRRDGRLETTEGSPATGTYEQPGLQVTRPTVRRVAQGRERSATASPLSTTTQGGWLPSAGTSTRGDMHLWRHPSGSGTVGGRRAAKARAPKGARRGPKGARGASVRRQNISVDQSGVAASTFATGRLAACP